MSRPDASRRIRPLTERVLSALPGRRAPWLLAWALVPWANAGVNLLLDNGTSAVWEQRPLFVVLNYAALSFAVLLTLWATERIARRLELLRSEAQLTGSASREPFERLSDVLGPIVITVAAATVFAIGAFGRDGFAAALLRGTTWLIIGIALATFLWTYAWLQLDLHRVGQTLLRRENTVVDPGLGLLPLGGAAFTGLWVLLVALVPILLTGLPDVVALVVCLTLLGAGLAAFVFSLLGLHGQMVEVKKAELALARELYAQAYVPVREQRSLEALEEQRSLLSAADALEKRAHAIHDWPIKEGTWGWVIGLATSVAAIACARLLLTPLGI
jgi:hypothetical protein